MHKDLRYAVLVPGAYAVFRRCGAGDLFEGGAEAAFAGKAGGKADVLDGGIRGFQKELGGVDAGGDHISVGRKTGFPLEQAAEIKGA